MDNLIRENTRFSTFDNTYSKENYEFMDHLIDDSYIARGLGLITATVGHQSEFYLYSKYDNNYEHVVIELKGRNGETGKTTILNEKCACPVKSKAISIDYIYDEDRIKVTYTPLAEGIHTLMLSRNGLSICRSPYYVSVEKSPTNSRSRIRLGTKKYKMVTKFGKSKHATGEIKDNNIVPLIGSCGSPVIIRSDNVSSASEENYISAGTDVMSIVTKFESNSIGCKKRIHTRMSSIAEKIPENYIIDENSTSFDVRQKIETRENYDTNDNVLDIKNMTEKTCSNDVNRKHKTPIVRKCINSVLDDRLTNDISYRMENPSQTTEHLEQNNNEIPIIDSVEKYRLKINSTDNDEPCVKNEVPFSDEKKTVVIENTIEPELNPNDVILQQLITDSTRYNISTPLAASIITKIKNLVCEKCSKRMFKTLSELPRDTNTTIQYTNSSEIRSSCETVLEKPIRVNTNTTDNFHENTTSHTDEESNNSPNLEQIDTVDKTVVTCHLLNEKQFLDNNSENVCSSSSMVNTIISPNLIVGQNTFDCELSKISEKNISDTISTSHNEYNVEKNNTIHQEPSLSSDKSILQNRSINEEYHIPINSNIFNINTVHNSENKIELQVQNTQKSHDAVLIESNRCDEIINKTLNCINREYDLTTLDTNLSLINNTRNTDDSLDTDESKLIKNNAVSIENLNTQSCDINDPILASIKVTLASTKYKERNPEQKISDISETEDKSATLTTVQDINHKLMIERSIEPIFNHFKNNIIEKILQLCLNGDSSNTYYTQLIKNNNTKLIKNLGEIPELQNTDHEDSQIENVEMLTTQVNNHIDKDEISKEILDKEKTDHNRLLEYIENIIKKDIILSKNCIEPMAETRLQKIVNTALHRPHYQQKNNLNFEKIETKNISIEATILETSDNVNTALKNKPKDLELDITCNNGEITKDVLVETPHTVEITTETVTTTKPNIKKIDAEHKTLLSNDTETIVTENTNIIEQEITSNNPVSKLSDTVTVEESGVVEIKNLHNGQISDDFQTSTTDLKTTLTKLFNISKLATIKIQSTEEIDTMTNDTTISSYTGTDVIGKSNSKITSELLISKNNENIAINKLNTVEVKKINEILKDSNDVEVEINNVILRADNNETIEVPNTFELDTKVKTSILNDIEHVTVESVINETDNSKSLEKKTRFKLPSLNVAEILIEENNVTDTLVSNCPVTVTIEIETSDTKFSKVTITVPVDKKSNISILNPSETVLINEPRVYELESCDTKNFKEDTKIISKKTLPDALDTINIEELKTLINMPISSKNEIITIEDPNKASNYSKYTLKLLYNNETDAIDTPNLLFGAISKIPISTESEIMISKPNIVVYNETFHKQLNINENITVNKTLSQDQISNETETTKNNEVNTDNIEIMSNSPNETIEPKEVETITKTPILVESLATLSDDLNEIQIETINGNLIPIDIDCKIVNISNVEHTDTTSEPPIKNGIPDIPINVKIKPVTVTSILYDTQSEQLEKSKQTEKKTVAKPLLKDTDYVIFNELKTVEIDMTNDISIFGCTHSILVEEKEIVAIDTLPENPVSNDNLNIPIEKEIDTGIKSIISHTISKNTTDIPVKVENELNIETLAATSIKNYKPYALVDTVVGMEFEILSENSISNSIQSTLNKNKIETVTDEILVINNNPIEPIKETAEMKIETTSTEAIKESNIEKIENTTKTLVLNHQSITKEEPQKIEIETLLNYANNLIFKSPNMVEKDTITDFAISTDYQILSDKEPKKESIDTQTENIITNKIVVSSNTYTQTLSFEEPKELDIDITSEFLISDNNPVVSVKESKKRQLDTMSKSPIHNDNPTVPVENIMEIETENVLERLLYDTDTFTFKESNTVQTEIIKTTSDPQHPNNALSNVIQTILIEEPNELETETISLLSITNNNLAVLIDKTKELEIETPSEPPMLSNNGAVSIDKLKEPAIDIIPEILMNYDNYSVLVEEVINIENVRKTLTNDINTVTFEKCSINEESQYPNILIASDITNILIEKPNELKIETTVEPPISTNIPNVSVKKTTDIEPDMRILNNPIELESEKTTTQILNNSIIIPTDVSKEFKTNTSSEISIINDITEPIEEENKIELETIFIITNQTVTEQNNLEKKSVRETLQIDTNTVHFEESNITDKQLIPTDISTSIEKQAVKFEETDNLKTKEKIKALTDPMISNNNPTLDTYVGELKELEIKILSESPIQYDNSSVLVEEDLEIYKAPPFVLTSNNISNNTQTVLFEKLKETEIETIVEIPISTDISSFSVENTTKIEIEPVTSTITLNDVPDIHVKKNSKKLESEKITAPILNDISTVTTDFKMEIKIDTHTGLIEELNKMKIETTSMITTPNYSSTTSTEEFKVVDNQIISKKTPISNETLITPSSMEKEIKSMTIILNDTLTAPIKESQIIVIETEPDESLNDDTTITFKEPNIVETEFLIKNQISIDAKTLPVKEIEEVKIGNTSKIPVYNSDCTIPVEEIMQIEIKSVPGVHLLNEALLIMHTSESNEVEIGIDTMTKIPIQYTDIITEPVFEDVKEFETKIIHETLLDDTDAINFEDSEKVIIQETTSKAPATYDDFSILVEESMKIETESISVQLISNDIPNTIVEDPKELESNKILTTSIIYDTPIESTYLPKEVERYINNSETKNTPAYSMIILSNYSLSELIEEPMEIDTISKSIIQSNFPAESVDDPKIMDIDTTSKNISISNYNLEVQLGEKTHEIETFTVTDALLLNNPTTDAIKKQNVDEIDGTLEFVVTENTPDVLVETANEIKIESISLSSKSNNIPNMLIEESKVLQHIYESLNNTVVSSPISNYTPNVQVKEDPKGVKTEIILETSLPNDTQIKLIDESKEIVKVTVPEPLLDNIVTSEESNLVKIEMTMAILNNRQIVSTDELNEMGIETLNYSPSVQVKELSVEGIETLPMVQKSNDTKIKLKEIKTTMDTRFLHLDKAKHTDKTKPVEIDSMSYYDIFKSNNTELLSKTSLLSISQANVKDISNSVAVNNTFDLSTIREHETITIEPISNENEYIPRIQLLNFTKTHTEEMTPTSEFSSNDVTETVQQETSIRKNNIVTPFEPVDKSNYDDTLISNNAKIISIKISDDSYANKLEEKNLTLDDINVKIINDKRNIENISGDITLQTLNVTQMTTEEEKSDIFKKFSGYGETSKKILSDDKQNLQEKTYGIQKFEMSMQRVQTSDEDYFEKTFVQLEETEKIVMEQNYDVMDDDNKTTVDDKLYTVNESDLNAILCASSLQEALTLLDSKIKFKFKHKSRKSSSKITNSAMCKSSGETCSSCSDGDEKNSKFTEAQEFFKKIEEKSTK